jgi:hypothetical protein
MFAINVPNKYVHIQCTFFMTIFSVHITRHGHSDITQYIVQCIHKQLGSLYMDIILQNQNVHFK